MQERFNWHAWKACVSAMVPRVRIPLSPPIFVPRPLGLVAKIDRANENPCRASGGFGGAKTRAQVHLEHV